MNAEERAPWAVAKAAPIARIDERGRIKLNKEMKNKET